MTGIEMSSVPTAPSALRRPQFSARVSAGFPSPADDHLDRSLDLHELLISHPAATFYVRLAGDSMKGAGLHDGDLLIVDRSLTAVHGDVVIACLDGDLTVKRLYRRGGVIQLRPDNPDFAPIEIGDGREFEIWGVVTGSIRQLKKQGRG
jgi:DNA polymerase V